MKKKIQTLTAFLLSVCLTLSIAGVSNFVYAAQTNSTDASQTTVTTTYQTLTSLYARTEPSTRSDSTRAFIMSKGTTFTSTGTVNDLVYGSSKKWARFSKNGKTYYCSTNTQYVKVISSTSAAAASETSSAADSGSAPETTSSSQSAGTSAGTSAVIYKVNTSLNVRSGPGTSYSRLGTLSAGTQITVTGTSVVSGKTWGKFNYNGKTGWVSLAYCTKVSEVSTGSQSTTTESQTTTTESQATTTESQSAAESQTTSSESETASSESASTVTIYKTSTALNVRSGPGTTYSILGTLSTGTQITVTETSLVSGKTWGKIDYNGKNGWISLAYCTKISTQTVVDSTETPAYIDQLAVGTILSEEEADSNIDELFCSYKIKSGDAVYQRINGKSYQVNNNISLSELRYLKMIYYNFDHQIAVGEMIVNYQIADKVLSVFRELYQIEYEIESICLIDNYWAGDGQSSDEASIEANNTSCFCYREKTASSSLSNHALGLAIDINPLYNPYISSSGTCAHTRSYPYLDRDCGNPHVIVKGDACYNIFIKYGFTWGGNWTSPIDYQHFEIKIN